MSSFIVWTLPEVREVVVQGLAIAKEIVLLHGGTMTARSENEIIEFETVISMS